MKKTVCCLFAAASLFMSSVCYSAESMAATDLRCCDMTAPEGVDAPVFSWKLLSEKSVALQSAWEIEIADRENAFGTKDVVWKSGKTMSGEQMDIRPASAGLKHGITYFWRVRVWDDKGNASAWSAPARFSIGLPPTGWKSKWITSAWGMEKMNPTPYFRKSFTLSHSKSELKKAVAYFCGLGYGDLYVNGALADSTRVLDPAQTDYEQKALYSTFDVTDRLRSGENALGVMIAEGWYGQGKVWNMGMKYGDPRFTLQLELFYTDGTKQTVVSDESWLWHEGPVLKANVYAGEYYDARKEIKGWAAPGLSEKGWQKAVLATGIIPPKLYPQMIPPIRLQKEIKAVGIKKLKNGKYVIDFGVNIAGVPKIRVKQPKGTVLTLRLGELVAKNGEVGFGTTGTKATGVVQTAEYTCAGGRVETWNPRFTYAGFRYAELSGFVGKPKAEDFALIPVHTDLQQVGNFECSDPQINRLHTLAVRTLLSNVHGLPTDCPQREKAGWLGDAHAMAPFGNCNFDMLNFWDKYMGDIRTTSSRYEKHTLFHKYYNRIFYFEEKPAGLPYMIAPGRRLCGVASPDWGTAVVQLPWDNYLYYGDVEALRTNYPMMKQWVAHIEKMSTNDTIPVKHIVPYGLGDWCTPEWVRDCPIAVTSTAFHYLDATIMEKVAKELGKTEDAYHYAELRKAVRAAFNVSFFDKEKKTYGSQTADVLALNFGLVPDGEEKAVSDAIVRNMHEKYHDFMHVGIFGIKFIGQALSRFGNAEAAWKMFTKKGDNSFAYMWEKEDATSLWEILPINAKSAEVCVGSDVLCDGGSSLNHPMQGGYDVWFYEDIAGIRPDESGAGFKVTRFEPTMTGQLDWAKGSINTVYGKVESSWKHVGGKLEWTIVIPTNASGLVALPSGAAVTVDGKSLAATGFEQVEEKAEKAYYRFPAGTYKVVY